MVFVEVFRLFVAVCGALVGLTAGNHYAATAAGRSTGAAIGVLVGYVVGGVVGRLTEGGMREATRSLRDVPAPELLSGMLFGSLGLLIGVIVCIPLFVFVREDFDFLITAAVAWVIGGLGLRLGMAKGRQLADALGVTRHLMTSRQDVAAGADLADTSAVMDRSFLVMGQIGLFGPELLIPEPVADELATLADGPDPVSARRAATRARGDRRTQEARHQSHLRAERRPRRCLDRGEGFYLGRSTRRSGRHLLGGDGSSPGGGGRACAGPSSPRD